MQKGAGGRIAAYFDSPAYGYTVGDASNPAVYLGQLKRFDRRALFIKPGFVVIHDLLQSSAAPARYDWLFHSVAPIETAAAAQSFALGDPARGESVGRQKEKRIPQLANSGNSPLTSAATVRATLRGRFLFPSKLSLAVTKGYPVEPVDGYSTRPVPPEKYAHEWTLTATCNAPTVNEDIVTAMQIRRLAPAAEPEARIESLKAANAFGVRMVAGSDKHIILFRRRDAKGAMSGGGLESDGDVAAVRFDAHGGGVRGAFAAAATRLRFRGQALFRSATPADGSLPMADRP